MFINLYYTEFSNNRGFIMNISNNGFLKLDNSIIDYWMSRLNHSEFKTLLAIYRKTIGWNKQYDKISHSQIAALTGLTTRSVRTAIASLENLNLTLSTGSERTVKVYSINISTLYSVCLKSDDFLEMEVALESISKSDENNSNSDEDITLESGVKLQHKRHSKDTNKIKVKETTNINIHFSDFWDKYDYCKGKKSDVEAKWIALTDEERTLTMESLDKYLLSTHDKTYRKYPMSYLNTEAWNDEHIVPATSMASGCSSQHNVNNVYSASFKPFEDNSSKHTKDELESNLEALSISSAIGVVGNSTDTKDAHISNTDIVVVDALAISSQIHWSELKAKGLLKSNKNPTAIAPNTSKSKEIDDFLSKFSSKSKYSNKDVISGNSVIDNDCIS